MSYTLGSAWQWYATASDLINTRKFYSVEGKPVPIRQLDGQQAGYYPTLADKEQDRNYQKFYTDMFGRTNKYGKKEYRRLRPEYLELQQVISDRFNVISYVPEDRHTQNKNVSQNTKISTRPVGVVKQPTPDVFDPGLAEYEEQLLEEAGGRIEPVDPSTTSGNAYPTQYFAVVPEASAQEEEIPYLMSANIQITFIDSDIGGFSSSVPANDIGRLQGGINDRYPGVKMVLIGTSTNQPLMTVDQVFSKIDNLLITVPPTPPTIPTPPITVTVPPPTTPTPPITVTIPPPTTPTPPITVTIPPPTTPTPPTPPTPLTVSTDQNWWSDTNILIGLIAGGALVVPIFSKLFKK